MLAKERHPETRDLHLSADEAVRALLRGRAGAYEGPDDAVCGMASSDPDLVSLPSCVDDAPLLTNVCSAAGCSFINDFSNSVLNPPAEQR